MTVEKGHLLPLGSLGLHRTLHRNTLSTSSTPLLVRRATIHETQLTRCEPREPKSCAQCAWWRRRCSELQTRCTELQRKVELDFARSAPITVRHVEQGVQTVVPHSESVGTLTDAQAQNSQATQVSNGEFLVSACTQTRRAPKTCNTAVQHQPDRLSIGAQVGPSLSRAVRTRDAVCSATLDDEASQARRLELLSKIDALLMEAEGYRNQLCQEQDMRRKVENRLLVVQCQWSQMQDIVQAKAWRLLPSELPLSRIGYFIGSVMEFSGRGDFWTLIMPSLDSYLLSAANSARKKETEGDEASRTSTASLSAFLRRHATT